MKKKIVIGLLAMPLVFLLSCSPSSNSVEGIGLRISEIKSVNGGSSASLIYSYFDDGRIKRMSTTGSYTVFKFEYDSENRLIYQSNANETQLVKISITYQDGRIRAVLIEKLNDFDSTREEIEIDMITPESYVAYEREIKWNTETVLSEKVYDITLEFDNQGRVTFYQRSLQEGVQIITLNFEYTNGNLSKVIQNGNIENARELFYDAKFNYNLGVGEYKANMSYPSLPVSEFTKQHLAFIPRMLYFDNVNNVIEIKESGVTTGINRFEYNIYGFPSRTINSDNDNIYNEFIYE